MRQGVDGAKSKAESSRAESRGQADHTKQNNQKQEGTAETIREQFVNITRNGGVSWSRPIAAHARAPSLLFRAPAELSFSCCLAGCCSGCCFATSCCCCCITPPTFNHLKQSLAYPPLAHRASESKRQVCSMRERAPSRRRGAEGFADPKQASRSNSPLFPRT